MHSPTLKKSTAWAVLLTQLVAYTVPTAQAAPGTLANVPLYLNTAVDPNIMFLLDDFGSMEWEALVRGATSGVPEVVDLERYYVLPSANNGLDQGYITSDGTCTAGGRTGCYPYAAPSEASIAGAWRLRNSSYNALYYNPEITYTPWDGADGAGNPLYTNATPGAARVDPANPGLGTLNLTQDNAFRTWNATTGAWFNTTVYPAHYYIWSDSNSNGVVDTTDARTPVEIRPTTTSYAKAATRIDCVGATCTYAEEIQNFANWYSYYRKRSYVAKKAIGSLVDKTTGTRMGLQAYNNGLTRNATAMSTAANKLALLQNIYGTTMPCTATNCPSTPARTALNNLGALFEGSTSPILSATDGGTCQQNFSVVITDGYWNGASPGVGNTDGDSSSTFDGPPYGDGFANTLADVAMRYYERDLKTGLANRVPTTPGIDDAAHQHMVTYTVAFGITGTLDPATANPRAVGFNWPDPSLGDAQKIDDTWHAAFNGRGLFLSAQNPQQLNTALSNALADMEGRTSSAAAVAFNSTTLSENSMVYQAKFDSTKWSGELLAYALDPNNGNIAGTPTWNAATQINAQSPGTRTILTYNPVSKKDIPFRWDTSALSATQQADLNMGPSGTADGQGLARLNYLRGDRSDEGSTTSDFRWRSSITVLGDIAHSNPAYVGKPVLSYPDTAPFPTGSNAYSTYKSANSGRQGVVYVGANDGMLHGFNATTGDEVMAYIPHNLFSSATTEGLHYLTNKAYTHRYYVDLGPTIADAYVKTTPSSSAAWRTILVGGERGGGRGLFALDITNPGSFSESASNADNTVMWEFTSTDDVDLGYTYSKPAVALMNNGRWAAIVGNGYNDAGSGQAQLFIIYLDGGLDGVWTPGTDYIKITTGVGSAVNRNGLASATLVDLNKDLVVDRIYTGDLQGNMWAFDVSDNADSNWNVAYRQGSTPKPLFTAKNAAGTLQPITSRPVVAKHPTENNTSSPSNAPNIMVYFGTGQYIANGDQSNTGTQTFYGVWDKGDKERDRSHLIAQTMQSGFPANARVPTNNPVNYGTKYGWYIDLDSATAATGERVVVDPLIRDDYVLFNTMIPSTVPCTFGGSSWLMSVKLSNGGRPDTAFIDYNKDGIVNSSDAVGNGSGNQNVSGINVNGIVAGSKLIGNKMYTCSSDGTCPDYTLKPPPSPYTGRTSWKEVIRR